MVLTGENRNTGRKNCHNATLSTTNLTYTDLGSNTIRRGKGLVTNSSSHDTARYIYFPLCFEWLTICISSLNESLRLADFPGPPSVAHLN